MRLRCNARIQDDWYQDMLREGPSALYFAQFLLAASHYVKPFDATAHYSQKQNEGCA